MPIFLEESDTSDSFRIGYIATEPHPSICVYDDIVCVSFDNKTDDICKNCDGRSFTRGIGDRIIECASCAPVYIFHDDDPEVIDKAVRAFIAMEEAAQGRY